VSARPERSAAVFEVRFLEDLCYWTSTNRKVALRLLDLIEASLRDPFAGIGKPEALRGNLAGLWSRRISDSDRLIYRVESDRVTFIAGRSHYAR
jgi:toxin YoeB